LDVSIAIFKQATSIPTQAQTQTTSISDDSIVAAVQESETRLLPMYLRYRLEQSGAFGAVRVIPEVDNGVELQISGNILQSDGSQLRLAIIVQDSRGETWLQKTYEGTAMRSESVSDDVLAEDAFASLFSSIVRDLTAQLNLHQAQISTIKSTALMRYGHGLVPTAFAPYFSTDANGVVSLQRLPATDDPLLKRILDIREREYLFVDVVDESYRRFYNDVKPVYDLWRQAQDEQRSSSLARTAQELNSTPQYERGSYRALQENYNNYRWTKVQELYVQELGEGFTNEVDPTQLELNDSIYKLSGTLEQQYRDWRRILAELFALETSASAAP
jgi:hypothetical protein